MRDHPFRLLLALLAFAPSVSFAQSPPLQAAIQRPNGITLSLDERTLHVDDIEGDKVYAFDVMPDGQVANNKRSFVTLHELDPGSLGKRSRADGMAIDGKGRLYVGTSSGVR